MKQFGISTIGDIRALDLSLLENHFGQYGGRLFELARGIDHNPVVVNRVRKQISAEDTFERDLPLAETKEPIRRLAERVWNASKQNVRAAQTIVLKLKTREFNSLTRSLTQATMPTNLEAFTEMALSLRERVDLGPRQLYRLVGIGLTHFQIDLTEQATHGETKTDALLINGASGA